MINSNITVFKNYPKIRIRHCERSELRLHFERKKVNQKFQKPEACVQTVLSDMSILIEPKVNPDSRHLPR